MATGMNQQTVLYDVEKLKLYAFATTDVVGGASPTYKTGVTCEGISDVSLAPDIKSATLRGDGGMIIARKARADMLTLSFTYGRLGLDALAVMLGSTVTTKGAGTSEVATWTLSMPNFLPFFKCEFEVTGTDNGVGDVHAILYKCQLKSATFIDSKTDAFGQPKVDLEAIPLLSTGKIGDIKLYKTQTALDA